MTGWIQTYSGVHVDPLNPHPDTIRIEDIAHALSNICRFTGHTDRFYSVAEHSVRVARLVPPDQRRAALLHDASEAYLCDIASPVKALIPGYAEAEDRLSRVIADKFVVAYPWSDEIKRADRIMLHTEALHLMGDPEWARGDEVAQIDPRLMGWDPLDARAEFLEMWNDG